MEECRIKKRNNFFLFFVLFFTSFLLNSLYTGEAEHSTLVNISSVIPGIHIDLKYSTADNFTGEVVYDFQECLLHADTASRLREVQVELEKMGMSLKIWDGYRPFKAQEKFWKLVPDTRYVSNPKKGGRHTRGTAIDLTIVTKDGLELPMPSGFDDFSEKAHRYYIDASEEEIHNREFLGQIMEKHGFIGLETEWWHFDLVEWQDYPPIKEEGLETKD